MPRSEKERLPVLAAGQLSQIIKVCNVRDKAIVLFMVDSGLRRSEVINMNWNDIDMQSGLIGVDRERRIAARLLEQRPGEHYWFIGEPL